MTAPERPDADRPALRLAVHSTHEAAEKIAGIGAVLDGILPQKAYADAFPQSLLVGPYPFPEGRSPLCETLFDSQADSGAQGSPEGALPERAAARLREAAAECGTRIVFGRRALGTKGAEVRADVLLVSPSGLRRWKLNEFRFRVRDRFGFDLGWYEDTYPAIDVVPDGSLDRILRYYESLRGPGPHPYPPGPRPEAPLHDHWGRTFFGGAPFLRPHAGDPGGDRVSFRSIRSLDSFASSEKANPFLLELQYHVYAAAPLWQAARILIEEVYRPQSLALFAHDWLGVPLFWAMKIEEGSLPCPATTVYFAHEARIARMLVEGTVNDKRPALAARCHPDGHDVSFYAYLSRLDAWTPPADIDRAFPEVSGIGGKPAFEDIFYHALNRQAARFDRVVAVGGNVRRETELILRGMGASPPVSLCPNGIPDFTRAASPHPGAKAAAKAEAKAGAGAAVQTEPEASTAFAAKAAAQDAARERLAELCALRFGFRPDVIFTGVNRCELSKAPWRNVDFFRAWVESPANAARKALFVWLSRPKPLPTAEQVARWAEWGWPVEHRGGDEGGDLRGEEVLLWEMIRRLNATGEGRFKILYVNQFGWAKDRLGALDPARSTFLDLRLGTDVEIGLSIYEPFGIAPLEPFSSGAVCLLSDSSGCALHLEELRSRGLVSDDGYVIGRFLRPDIDPARVDLSKLREIEGQVYAEMIAELEGKLAKPREERLRSAERALPHISWAAATRALLDALGLPGRD